MRGAIFLFTLLSFLSLFHAVFLVLPHDIALSASQRTFTKHRAGRPRKIRRTQRTRETRGREKNSEAKIGTIRKWVRRWDTWEKRRHMTQGERENRQKRKKIRKWEKWKKNRDRDTWTHGHRGTETHGHMDTEEQRNRNTKMAKIRPGATNGRTASDQKNGQNRWFSQWFTWKKDFL